MDERALSNLIDEGAFYLEEGKNKKAIESFEKIIKAGDSSGIAHYGLGLLAFQNNKMADAKAFFLKAVEDNSNFPESLNMLGVVHHLGGNLDDAVTFFNKAIEVKDDYVEAKRNLAETYLSLKKHDKTFETLQSILVANPKDIDVILRIADFYFETEQLDNCTVYLKKALTLDPEIKEAQELLERIQKNNE